MTDAVVIKELVCYIELPSEKITLHGVWIPEVDQKIAAVPTRFFGIQAATKENREEKATCTSPPTGYIVHQQERS